MTSTDMGNARHLERNTTQKAWHWIALVVLGIAIGYLVFGAPKGWEKMQASISYDAGTISGEDWHGNVRRSSPGR